MLFDDFLVHVLPSVPGCPEEVAIDHIRRAARRFCDKTLAWNFEDCLTTSNGQTVYPLAVSDEIERVRLQALKVDGCDYTTVDPMRGRSWARRQNGGGRFGFLDNPTDLVIYPAPIAEDREIWMQLAVRPSLAATEWPDELGEYVTDIADGAISTLAVLPKQGWTDAQIATLHGAKFLSRCSVIGINVSHGYQSQRRRTQRFF